MRVFIAIPVDPPIKDKLLRVQKDINVSFAKVRWCTSEQLHLTLKFLGEVPDHQVASVSQALQRVADATSSFEMLMEGSGCFPPQGRVRIIWMGGSESSGTLAVAVEKLENELTVLGFPKEKRTFSVHFTLGRVKYDDSRGKLRESVLSCSFEQCRQTVREFVLYQSTLGGSGAQYTILSRAFLKD